MDALTALVLAGGDGTVMVNSRWPSQPATAGADVYHLACWIKAEQVSPGFRQLVGLASPTKRVCAWCGDC